MQTLRMCMELCQGDDERLTLYSELKLQLKGAMLDSYPSRELQWLVSVLWNRGCRLCKMERRSEAIKLMDAALNLEMLRPDNRGQKEVRGLC